jgi:hypothetical protein
VIVVERRALLLAGIQAADLAVTQLSSSYGDDHLDHLGVPRALRPALPAIKAAAVVALVATHKHRVPRSIAGAALVAYYAAAVSLHVRAGDGLATTAPAAGCCLLATTLV